MKSILKHYADIVPFLGEIVGENCEVVLQDTRPDQNCIVAIANGHVSGRHVGDGSSELVLQAIKDQEHPRTDRYNYMARTKDGRVIKSSSVYITDDEGKTIGLFGINYDITNLIMAGNAIGSLVNADKGGETKVDALTTNVTDLLDQLIEEADQYIAKPVAMMTKEDKIRAVQFLNEKGAFLVKKAGDKVTKHYDISKYTLYNYLDSNS